MELQFQTTMLKLYLTLLLLESKKQSGVALVSGGGSGHEPAHAGFVAEGMLDAAVCGEIFTSPTPDKILDAIKAVDNGDGVLLVIKNYAGDVMNFEMAQEMAQMEDIKVESVIVRDDIAISDPEKRRGVAGTVFVHKYAGYLAEKGVALDEIKSKVEALLPDIKSIGMALTPPMVPTTGKMVSILKTIKWKLVSVFTVKKVYIVKTYNPST